MCRIWILIPNVGFAVKHQSPPPNREVHLLTKIITSPHPHILQLVDHHEDSKYIHIITEKYTGGELFDVIGKHTTSDGCLPEEYAACIIKCVLDAVAHLYSLGIVHRDVKPENILFEESSERDEDDDHDYV